MKSRNHAGLFVLCLFTIGALFPLIVSPTFAQSEGLSATNDAMTYAPLNKVPEKARNRPNPLEADPQAVAAGGKLFEQHCAECHGRKGEGGAKGASLLRSQVTHATPGSLFWILTNGVVWHGMPVWSKLPEPQRWQIVTFLKSLKPEADRQATIPQ